MSLIYFFFSFSPVFGRGSAFPLRQMPTTRGAKVHACWLAQRDLSRLLSSGISSAAIVAASCSAISRLSLRCWCALFSSLRLPSPCCPRCFELPPRSLPISMGCCSSLTACCVQIAWPILCVLDRFDQRAPICLRHSRIDRLRATDSAAGSGQARSRSIAVHLRTIAPPFDCQSRTVQKMTSCEKDMRPAR